MKTVKRSLRQLLGNDYVSSVISGTEALSLLSRREADELADEQVDFFPDAFRNKVDALLPQVGKQIVATEGSLTDGAPTNSFRAAASICSSPLTGIGCLRLGQNGRLYMMAKSEHYHTPLGHNFPGYRLIDIARSIGITNATHNNTRGYITRFLERELVRTANGIAQNASNELEAVLSSREPHVLNRVINLETGSLACEAAIKMMLHRFYGLEATDQLPRYSGRIPVFFVMADDTGGSGANYHGTTITAQTFRGLWKDLYQKIKENGIYEVCPVKINDYEDFKAKFEKYNTPPYKVAGFLHEIILMNYGGILLDREILHSIYKLCHSNDTPVLCDEIQTCMWYPGMYLFREYGLNPDFVVIGKGFPGGQYPASKVLTTYDMDTLSQFGALVTNGQEELASLSYLITMEFAEENADNIRIMGDYFEQSIRRIAQKNPDIIDHVDGKGFLLGIFFYNENDVLSFTSKMNGQCVDITAQAYKKSGPPASALTKPPLIISRKAVDFLTEKIDETLRQIRNPD